MAIDVRNVADFIIHSSGRVSNLKLQKLLYYVQGWHLGFKGTPLFQEEIQAWVHGPVVPEIFREYRKFERMSIDKPSAPVSIPTLEAKYIKNVLALYSNYSEYDLVRLSHSEPPWLIARNGIPDSEMCSNPITHDSMREFFAKRARV